jgi:hypothetical protein
MTNPAPAPSRFHAAIFPSTDPAARSTLLVGGSLATIAANTPKGGCWRLVPAGVHRAAEVPPLRQLPAPIVAPRPAPAASLRRDAGTVKPTPPTPPKESP